MKNAIFSWFAGIDYEPGDIGQIVAFLVAHPEQRRTFHDKSIEVITGMMAWGDYRSAPEFFVLLCSVLAAVDGALGKHVLQPVDDISPDNDED